MARRDQLIQPNGQPVFGVLPEGVEQINYLDYDLRTTMDRKRSKLAKRLCFNQFQFISFASDQLIVGLAIVDLKLVRDRKSTRLNSSHVRISYAVFCLKKKKKKQNK